MAISQRFLDRTVTMTTMSLWKLCQNDNTVTLTTLHCHGWQQYLFCEWQHYTVTMAISQRFLDRTVTMTTMSLWKLCQNDNTVTLTTLHCHGWQCSVVNGSITRLPWQYHNVSLTGLSLWQQCHYENSVKMTTQLPWQHYIVTVDNVVLWMAALHGYHGNITTFPWQDCHYDNTVTMTTLSIWQLCQYDNTTLSRLTTVPVLRMAALHGYHGNITTFPWQDCRYDNTVTMTTLSIWQHSYLDNTTLSRLTTEPALRMAALHGYHGNITTFPWQDCHYDNTVNMTTLSLWQHSYHDNITLSRLTTVPVLRMTALHGYHGNITTFPWQDCHYDNTVTMTTLSIWQHSYLDNTTLSRLTTVHVLRMAALHGYHGNITTFPWQDCHYDNTVTMTTLSIWQHSYLDNTTLSRLTTVHVLRMAALHGYHGNITTFPWQDCHYDNNVTMKTLSKWQHSYLDNTTLSRLTM